MKTPVISIVGRSKTGKTSLIEGIIKYLTSKGIKVVALKHAFHPLEMNREKDGERLFESGAIWSGVISDEGKTILIGRVGLYGEALSKLLSLLDGTADIFILEGFKKLPFKKIEVVDGKEPMSKRNELIALVGDAKPEKAGDIPFFKRNDVEGICSLIMEYINLSKH